MRATAAERRAVDVLLLPVTAVRLAGRCSVPLAIWFSVGSILRFLLIQATSHLGHGSHPAWRHAVVLVPMSVAVLSALVVGIGMLFTLGRRLASIHDPDEPYLTAIGRTLFPFVLIYLGWNLYYEDLFDVLRADAQRLADAGDPNNAGNILELSIPICLLVALAAWALRIVSEHWYDKRGGRALGVLTAFFEVNFALYGLYSIVQLLDTVRGWVTGRAFWQDLPGGLPGLGPVKDALVLPLVWLAIAAVVFGLEMHDREAIEGTPLESLPDKLTGRRKRLADAASRNVREKYVPLVHAVRLVFRAGLPLVAWFCLCYATLGVLLDRLQRGVLFLIGPGHSIRFWNLALTPIEFAHRMLYEILRLALLAAMFDLVMRRTAEVSDERSSPARRAAASDQRAGAA